MGDRPVPITPSEAEVTMVTAKFVKSPSLLSWVVNGVLAIKPLATLAKQRARAMMIERAETLGVPWRATVQQLRSRQTEADLHPDWETTLTALQQPQLQYPDYYVTSFHAYAEGNLGWQPAMEVEVAAQAVHARIWPEAGAAGDARLRQSYHDVLKAHLPVAPRAIADLGCGVGMSTETLQATFPDATLTGVDLSPYFLAVAHYRTAAQRPITWHHAPAEATGLPAASFDLVSACLLFHELPQGAAIAVLQEARRLLRPGGHLAIMDMNPGCETFAQMPPFVFTLLKSTEPYLDDYLTLDFGAALTAAGFSAPQTVVNSPRHRTLLAQAIA
ncbi:MAG TPA: class I SAM-dependent methyltransferase [Candidatus Obscuribacterales bacterium]